MYLNNPEYVKAGNKKYKINTDFRVAIECNEIAESSDVSDTERPLAIIYKLFHYAQSLLLHFGYYLQP